MHFLNKGKSREAFLKDTSSDLNVIPMMSLMVVLIPVLLFSAKYSLLSEYEVRNNEVTITKNKIKVPIKKEYELIVNSKIMTLKSDDITLMNVKIKDQDTTLKLLNAELLKMKDSNRLEVKLGQKLKYKYVIKLLDVISVYKKHISHISIKVQK